MRHWIGGFSLIAGLAACGGGGTAGAPAGAGAVPTAAPTAGPAFPRAYVGTRSITSTNPPPPPGGVNTAAGVIIYAATATETEAGPPPGAPAGTTALRRLHITYSGAAPSTGMIFQAETLDSDIATTASGIALLAQTDTLIARDQDAATVPGTQFVDTRSVSTTYAIPPIVLAVAAGQRPEPLGATVRTVEQSVETAGAFVGAIGRSTDYTRTIAADGSFDEAGVFNGGGVHAMHQHADGSATSHDQVPGFSLRDVTVGTPSGSTLAVTVQTQGRTIGNPPIVTSTYTTPVWYAPTPLALATMTTTTPLATVPPNLGSPVPSACTPSARAVTYRNLSGTSTDVASGTQRVFSDQLVVDDAGLMLCRVLTVFTQTFDITTGAPTSATTDVTTLNYAGAPAGASASGRTRAR